MPNSPQLNPNSTPKERFEETSAATTTVTVSEVTSRQEIPPFSAHFTDKTLAISRSIYFKIVGRGVLCVLIVMFAAFSIYWGALWKTPDGSLEGWIVDFDQSNIGNMVSKALRASSASSHIHWTSVPPSNFPRGNGDVMESIADESAWVAVVVNFNASNTLISATTSANSSYDGTSAVTVYADEARSENAFRTLIRPTVQNVLDGAVVQFALQYAKGTASSSNLQDLLQNAPQVITNPVGYSLVNIRPYDSPVATAITFVGLIYLTILAFLFVMISASARTISGLDRHLRTSSVVCLRLATTFGAYLVLSVFYSLVSLAFQVDFTRRFGRSGFLIFWMVNYTGMLAVGLAIEAMLTLTTPRFIPFFLIGWIIANVSVCFMPLDVLPRIYRYGYGSPYYNISKAIRTILFSTKNDIGMNIGILLAWVALSCITLPVFQWWMRRNTVPRTERN